MKPRVELALTSLISLLWIQHVLCVSDELSQNSTLNKWTCTCSSYPGNQNGTLANCSTSCDCTSGNESIWTCICDANGLPRLAADGHNPNCFTGCNCTSGTSSISQGSKKQIFSKVVVIPLLISVAFTTIAFLALVMCYVYRRNRCPIQSSMLSSDKETSYNSSAKLISHRFTLASESKYTLKSPINHVTGCFQLAFCLYRSKTETLHETIVHFSYAELENATENFSSHNLIGLGGSSHVYRGQLKDGRYVAVKRLKAQGDSERDLVFLTEIELLSRLHHCHLVPLLGYCSELKGKHTERLLVFEYMSNGNLRDCLDGTSGKILDWPTRVATAIGAARGLEYLHEAAAPKILHSDVKSTNILLDEKWRAKITDLGMAKNLRADGLSSCSSSPARMQGTFGYFAPEYAIVGRASLKSDVFSFGVVLLELISGRQPLHKSTGKGEESLVIWATPRLLDGKRVISELPDPRLNGSFPEEEMQIMAYLAKECLLLDPDARPTMTEVVQILSTISPDKSKRRNIPISLFQWSPAHCVKREPYADIIIPHYKQNLSVEGPYQSLAESQSPLSKLSTVGSFPLHVDPNLYIADKEAYTVSVEHMERLLQLTSRASPDDETVDLTEPRFESFCVASTMSP